MVAEGGVASRAAGGGAVVRGATPADVPALAGLEALLFGPDAWTSPQLAEELAGVGRRGWVAEMNERSSIPEDHDVAGYAITMTMGEVADLQRIAVHPERQRAGLAHRLLGAALDAAREDGADRMLLEVSAENAPALAFYAAAGFTEIDRRARYYQDGADAIVMMRPLEAIT